MTSTHHTATEAKAVRIAKMGEDLGELYDALWQQVAWLHRKWEEYVALFGTKASRVELLNQAAPTFFRIVQDAMWEDVLLDIARLTDSPQSVGKPNLSLRRLPATVAHPEPRTKVEAALERALADSKFCRDWRNRHIAHRDLHLALGRGADPLEPASREKVREALKSLAEVLNAVATHYLDNTTFFESGSDAGGAESLLNIVDDGLKAMQLRRERLKAGTAVSEDWKPRSL